MRGCECEQFRGRAVDGAEDGSATRAGVSKERVAEGRGGLESKVHEVVVSGCLIT